MYGKTATLPRHQGADLPLGQRRGEPLRQTNDRVIVQTIIEKVVSNPATASDVTRALYKFVNSNWDVDSFSALAVDFANNADKSG